MIRREFITLLGGAAVAWPLRASAQQVERMRRIGVLLPADANDAEFQTRMGAFQQGLQEAGWSIGRNVKIDYRGARRRRRSRAVEGQEDHARLDAHLQMKRANLPKPNVGRTRR